MMPTSFQSIAINLRSQQSILNKTLEGISTEYTSGFVLAPLCNHINHRIILINRPIGFKFNSINVSIIAMISKQIRTRSEKNVHGEWRSSICVWWLSLILHRIRD